MSKLDRLHLVPASVPDTFRARRERPEDSFAKKLPKHTPKDPPLWIVAIAIVAVVVIALLIR